MEEKQLSKAEKLAEKILIFSRNTLLVNLRFLDVALSQFEMRPIKQSFLMTDGHFLLYNSGRLLSTFKQQKETVTRDYLHIVMHCIYRHMFVSPSLDRPLWDLATDIAVENVISELGLASTFADREEDQKEDIARFKEKCSMLTAEAVYHYLKSQRIPQKTVADIRSRFYADNHEIWYMTTVEKHIYLGDAEDDQNADGKNKTCAFLSAKELNAIWQQISERMQVNIETFGKQRGDLAGNLLQNLKEVNRERYDYTLFLKKFAVMGEAMKINDDEFDYVFYTYGLNLYKKMPLIEPLEYMEVKRIKEFVIAIDTSGSVLGEQVQKFVQKTYNILKNTESFFSKINLHIIQCDADIQEHIKITTQEEFDAYLETMQIKGLGGTDFRPVFAKVGELIKNKEFKNLKGLIYFTDGYGVFPERKPDYNTAFVFVKDDYEIPDVPPWAIKLILESNDI